jgi:hypothetical protein
VQLHTKGFGDVFIGERQLLSIGKLERAHIHRVGQSVLAEFCAFDVVAPAAVVGSRNGDTGQRRRSGTQCGHHVVAHPLHHGLGHRTTQLGRRIHGYAASGARPNGLQVDDVGCPAGAGAFQHGDRLGDGKAFRKPLEAG